MANSVVVRVALVGNPNVGKTSLFNRLTGLNQKTGNFPGVTVEKKIGKADLGNDEIAEITDLPGTYSLYARSPDECVVSDNLLNPNSDSRPDVVIVVADATRLKRSLLLFTQVADLGLPVIVGLNMVDEAETMGLELNLRLLSERLGARVVPLNSRTGDGVIRLRSEIARYKSLNISSEKLWFSIPRELKPLVHEFSYRFGQEKEYAAFHIAHQFQVLSYLSEAQKREASTILKKFDFEKQSFQAAETMDRYARISEALKGVTGPPQADEIGNFTHKLDSLLTHKIGGFVVFFGILALLFQTIFSWAEAPMDWIESGVSGLGLALSQLLPDGPINSLITEGIIAGLGGILMFIPQIALLFAFIAILEETGYMARVVFIMDRLMRPFGLNGRSVVPLISGVACAVPAIMSARSIENPRDRLLTIFVTPLMSCSARLPVFTVLIGLMVPASSYWGMFNLQGLVLMGLYVGGFAVALLSALLMKGTFKSLNTGFFMMELPVYRSPKWSNVWITIVQKVRAFVMEAGKVILAISVVLWILASYGPDNAMDEAEFKVREAAVANQWNITYTENAVASSRLEASFAGQFGKLIEPAIKPLGYDWKIGIALITSFAAREVFIGTMSTIYSIGADSENSEKVMERMRSEVNPETGKPIYSVAMCASLLVFYLFAMQCMSTLAVSYRETGGWKYPLLQLFYMTGLAYIAAFAVYNLLK